MAYELRIAGRSPVTFETEQEAVAAAKQALADNPDAEPEVIDLSTGRAAAPGADRESREGIGKIVGF